MAPLRTLPALLVLGATLGSACVAARSAPAAPRDPSGAAHALLKLRCLGCHGPAKLGGLDLRTRDAALKGGGRGPALEPGRPDRSLLLRLASGHGEPHMPPSGALPTAEQDVLRRWIAEGAAWPSVEKPAETYWAFRPVRAPAVPPVRRAEWPRNPIDLFVLAELERRGLSPAPEADRRELARRLSFDLLGLPPEPDEVEAFAADRRPDAYERLVDRYLASPRYGERWARYWLDVARFAESQGFERDKIRDHAWRYRDYVIRSFNRDKPYDRFVREQVAGDVLPDADSDSITATGFLVAGPWDEVGHTQASTVMRARVREDELEDIVSVVGQTFLGLTVNCARCHDHKFDPVPQRDYFRLQAALAGVRHGDRSILTAGQEQERQAALTRARERLRVLESQIAALDEAAVQRVRVREARQGRFSLPQPVVRWSFDTTAADMPPGHVLELTGGATISGGRLRLDGVTGAATSAPLPISFDSRTLEAWVQLGSLDSRGGSALTLEGDSGRIFDGLVYGERQPRRWVPGSNGFVRTRDLGGPDESTTGALIHVAATYAPDGRITFYRNGRPYGESYLPDGPPEQRLLRFPAGHVRVLFGLRHTGAGGASRLQGEIEEARVYPRALTPEEVRRSYEAGYHGIPAEALDAARTPEERRERKERQAALPEARAEVERLASPPLAYAANATAAPVVRVLKRGDVNQPAETVAAGGLSCLPAAGPDWGLSPDAPDAERRRKLADWLVSSGNPLTPRVAVNRVWQGHFGRGLAASPSDFGVNGEAPTHPALLDWLAAAFAAPAAPPGGARPGTRDPRPGTDAAAGTRLSSAPGLGWSLKRLHRLIVTSGTYRQSAAFNARAASVDSDNRLLWRFPPRRLEAEALRDACLAVSGQLIREKDGEGGGPGFRPFSVVISNSHFYHFEDRLGPEYNRRSIYRTVVNSGGIPLLETFDCPDPSVKTPRRGSTVTPLQALSLLNNSFMLRQAREFGERVTRQAGPGAEAQVDRAYRLALSRPPRPEEAARAAAFVRKHGLPAFCRVLLNSSEFVYVR